MNSITIEGKRALADYYLHKRFDFLQLEYLEAILQNWDSNLSECIILPSMEYVAKEIIKSGQETLEKDQTIEEAIEQGLFDSYYEDLYGAWYPMWNTVFVSDNRYLVDKVDELYEIGIGVIYNKQLDLCCLFIAGAGYDFYEQHWIPLFRDVLKWID